MKKLFSSGLNPESLMMTYGYNPFWSEGAAKPPVFLSSTFCFKTAEEGEEYFSLAYGLKKEGELGLIYSRLNNPNLQIAEERLNLWEKGSDACAIFSSGMAAITTTILTFLKPGDTLLAGAPLYGGTDHFLTKILINFGINVLFFDSFDDEEKIVDIATKDEVFLKGLKMILIESPTNPTNNIFDIKMLSGLAKRVSFPEKRVILAVDNTYLGPVSQHPILHGADLVLYSLTKYIGGHSDLIAGACLGSNELINQIKTMRTFIGNMSDPFTCWMTTRSLETLSVRMEKHFYNAKKVAKFLYKHKSVSKVYFPGNLSGNQLKIKRRQCLSDGAMIAFDIKGGKKEAFKFLNSLKLIKLAVSLGSTGSLVEHPFCMTHADVDPAKKIEEGITESMIRLSVGLENPNDIVADLKQAFDACQ